MFIRRDRDKKCNFVTINMVEFQKTILLCNIMRSYFTESLGLFGKKMLTLQGSSKANVFLIYGNPRKTNYVTKKCRNPAVDTFHGQQFDHKIAQVGKVIHSFKVVSIFI